MQARVTPVRPVEPPAPDGLTDGWRPPHDEVGPRVDAAGEVRRHDNGRVRAFDDRRARDDVAGCEGHPGEYGAGDETRLAGKADRSCAHRRSLGRTARR